MRNLIGKRTYNKLIALVNRGANKMYVFNESLAHQILENLSKKERIEVLKAFDDRAKDLKKMLNNSSVRYTLDEYNKMEDETNKLLTAGVYTRRIIEHLQEKELEVTKKLKKR